MKTLSVRLLLIFGMAVAAYAQPSIGGIANAASYDTVSFAQGSFIAIFGTNFGTTAKAGAPYPTTLGDVQEIDITPVSGGVAVKALLYFTSSGQINAILPSTAAIGDANVTVVLKNGQTSAAFKITVVKSRFGIFTVSQSGQGPAIVQNYVSASSTPLNGLTNSANDGTTLILWGTGVGPAPGGDDNHPQPGNFSSDVQILVGGKVVTPFYAGRSGFPGEDQINFTIPKNSGIPDSCYVQIVVQIGNQTSNASTLAKAGSSKACTHPLGLSASALQKLDTGGTVTVGLFLLSSSTANISLGGQNVSTKTQGVNGAFAKYTGGGLFSLETTGNLLPPTALGTCTLNKFHFKVDPNNPGGSAAGALAPPLAIGTVTDLDAGAKLVLSGNTKSADVPRTSPGYGATLSSSSPLNPTPDFLSAGTWTLAGTGGQAIGPFQGQITIPGPLNVNPVPAAINRSQDLVLNWTGGGTTANDFLIIIGLAAAPSASDATIYDGAIFTCTAAAAPGTFTVKGDITGQLPATAGTANATGILLINAASHGSTFTAPLVGGGNIDSGILLYTDGFYTLLPVN